MERFRTSIVKIIHQETKVLREVQDLSGLSETAMDAAGMMALLWHAAFEKHNSCDIKGQELKILKQALQVELCLFLFFFLFSLFLFPCFLFLVFWSSLW